ncbi:hypothetical protein SGRA_0614 [Saprospira grandis str. Lewin]|uniref:Uncharacterized protein n=1 Tax=Saprospira grandis (strain Lewin) TaxID=984262 RepID=H6L0C3_SAPGL|nr:hypothetical protein SGRA_0614 [Saprospira grandis str. Lewin]
MERSGLQAAALFLFQLILAEGWIAVAEGQTEARRAEGPSRLASCDNQPL